MTKADQVERVCERTGCSKKAAIAVVEEGFALVGERLCRGEKVKISGFGTLAANRMHARIGRHPQTSDVIPSRRVRCSRSSRVKSLKSA